MSIKWILKQNPEYSAVLKILLWNDVQSVKFISLFLSDVSCLYNILLCFFQLSHVCATFSLYFSQMSHVLLCFFQLSQLLSEYMQVSIKAVFELMLMAKQVTHCWDVVLPVFICYRRILLFYALNVIVYFVCFVRK